RLTNASPTLSRNAISSRSPHRSHSSPTLKCQIDTAEKSAEVPCRQARYCVTFLFPNGQTTKGCAEPVALPVGGGRAVARECERLGENCKTEFGVTACCCKGDLC
ncbi:hypothetical protein PENTCL1PPCAC_19192, partial [Pristionchus entomophagus]